MYRTTHIPLILGFVLLVSAKPLSGSGWRTGYLPSSSVSIGLAGGGIALPAQISLSQVNVAHIRGIDGEYLEYSNLRMFAGLGGNSIRWRLPNNDYPTMVHIGSISDDDIELRDGPSSEPLGYFGVRLITAAVARSFAVGGGFIGISITGAYQQIYIYSARSAWLSLGWQQQLTPWLRVGASIRNLGFSEPMNTAEESLKPQAGLGIALKLPWADSWISGDALYEQISAVESVITPIIALQSGIDNLKFYVGLRIAPHETLYTAGVQLSHKQWVAGYGYGYQNGTLGNPQMVSFGWRF